MKGLIKGIAERFGYQIFGAPRAFAAQRSLMGLLRRERINLILDVGANIGHFGRELRTLGYAGRIVSFEPLATAHTELLRRAASDPGWTVADRTAVGASAGSVAIHVSSNSESSSLLAMLPSHSHAAPDSVYVATETVPLNRLDDLCPLSSEDRVLLKIDVQGYEQQVLEGAPRILENCRGIISEMSLIPLYDGQALAHDMWTLLANKGFEVWSLEPVFRDPQTARLLQFDGIFVRKPSD